MKASLKRNRHEEGQGQGEEEQLAVVQGTYIYYISLFLFTACLYNTGISAQDFFHSTIIVQCVQVEKLKKRNLFGALFVSLNPAILQCQQMLGSHSVQFALAWANKNHNKFHVQPCHFHCFLFLNEKF